jgi:hypothetical protein
MLRRGDVLIRQEQHEVLVERRPHLRHDLLDLAVGRAGSGEVGGEIEAPDLGPYDRGQRDDLDRR